MPYIFELTFPGTALDYPDGDWASEIEGLLWEIESAMVDAAIALSLFEEERSKPAPEYDPDQREADLARKQEIESEIAEQRALSRYSPDHWDELYFLTEVTFKKEKWRGGQLPDSYRHMLPIIHARSYLFAMDRLDRAIAVLAEQRDVPQQVVDSPRLIREIMPHLRGVRNSEAHREDRIRGLRRDKPLDIKPIENNFIHAPDGQVLVIGGLSGNSFGSTMADGHYGKVEISPQVLGAVCKIVQQILDAFKWKGPRQHLPR